MMANTGLFDWTSVGLLRNLSSSVTTTFWSYFAASSEVTKTEGKHDDEYFKELDGIQDALTELYGNVAGIVLKQALSILKEQYDGNMDTFLTEFFWPAIELLSKLKQAEQSHVQGLLKEKERKSDSECDTTVTEDSDNQSYYSLCHSSQSECKNSNHSDQSECKDSSQGDISTGEDISIKSEEVGATLDDTEAYTLCVEQTVATSENKELNDDSLSDCDTSSASNNSNSEGKEFVCDNFWPLVHNSSVIVNFIECARDKFFNGDINLFVKLDESNNIVLCVKYLIGNTANEIDLSESQFGKIFTMEWKDELVSDSTDELGEVLKSCLASLEDSTEKLRWQEVVPQSVAYRRGTASSSGNHGDKSKKSSVQCSRSHGVSHDNGKSVKNDRNNCLKCDYLSNQGSYLSYNDNHKCSDKTTPHSPGYHKSLEFNKVLTDSPDLRSKTMEGTDGREIDKPRSPRTGGLHQHRHLEPPKTILDVDYKLLQSGVAILPGCRDLDGNAVVLIFTSSTLWKNQLINSTDLARLIMFYYSVPRETVRCRGLTIIADIRGTTTSTINTLLESLYLFENHVCKKGNLPQAISVVHLLTDKHTQSLVLKSPIYDVHAAFQIDLLLSSNLLCSYISPDQLPPVLEGTFQYNHDDWIRFHMRLDPFLANCRSVARYLANVIQELSVVDQVPVSAKEASHLVDHHENIIKSTFEDPRVQRLQNEGDSLLLSLQKEEINIGHTDDYRYAMEDITRLYRHVQETISRLMHISDTRITRLEKCYQLKDFDEECTKVISWLHTQGNECLQRHLVMADNLKAVRMQQKDFEKFYYAAMSHIEKGNDLLEEASTLAQSGDFDEVTGYKELARMLKRHLHEFSERLEETRERIEGTSKCYQLLDKTYEWALEAMKYVASMKMEHCATPEGLEKLLHSLELYLQEHPPISDDTFISMSDIAKKLGNDKLLEQCLTAQNRCQETQKMLTCRGNTLQQFREQLEQEASAARSTKSSSALNSNQRNYSDLCRYSSYSTVSNTNDINSVSSTGLGTSAKSNWEPKDMSTPVVPKTYSRTLMERLKKSTSFSSSSSSPASSPSHSTASTNSPSHVSRSPCVSSDISPVHSISSSQMFYQTPVPVLPVHNNDKLGELEKSLTDSSKENILDSANSRGFLTPNNSDLKVTSPNKAKNILRRAISTPQTTGLSSPIVEEDQGSESHNNRVLSLRQNGRTDSMITGSSDSLPSLPEEDEGVVTIATEEQDYIRKEWTPVPVNTHLTDTSCNTTPLRPLSDLKLSEEEIKSRRTLSLIMSEMVQTERDYVCSLRFIVEHYIPEMEREDVPQALRGKRNVIFGNIEKIFQFHQQYFLQEMEASKRNPFLIARYFLMHENQFHLYALYNKNKPKSDALMAEYGKLFFRDKQLELGDKMDLSSYLLKPVQRMGKYALLIKQVLKECSRTAPEYQDLKAAEEMVRFQLRHGNDLLAMDALRDCDVNLQEQGRLLRQEEFLVYHGRRKFMRHVFLFEDLILFSKTKRSRSGFQDTYLYKFSFKMSDIGLTQDYEGSGYKFEIWWRRRNTGESYVLQAPSSEHKKSWVKEMTKILWNQAIKNRENRLSELATMGIGNKPCLDIKPSSDNINDRFINIAVGSRDARSRNSIAVCSNDLLRQGNKRPHSIISVSSNSSSNSSQSGFGAMNLATSHTDSPRTYRRSLTFMSSESGIGTSIASGADIDSTKIDLADFSRAQSPPPYADFQRPHSAHILDREFGKPRIMNLPSHAEEMTDV